MAEIKDNTSDLKQRRKEALAKLPQFRGEVQSKNSIRKLPDVRVNEIFWVTMDDRAYIVADKDKHQMTIKALDETATISTGLTVYEMNKNIVSKEPLFDVTDNDAYYALGEKMAQWFEGVADKHFLIYGRDIHYVTLLSRSTTVFERDPGKFLQEFIDLLKPVGDLISIDFDTTPDVKSMEIWLRTAESKAELLYLMPYDKGIVQI